MHMTNNFSLAGMVMATIFFKGQSQPSCLKIIFPPKLIANPSTGIQIWRQNLTANQEAADKSRLVCFLDTAWPCLHQCTKKLVSLETKTKLDPSGGGKGGLISKL